MMRSVTTIMLFLASAVAGFSQVPTTARMDGVVKDQQGAIVPGAPVIITDTDTGAVHNLTTNNAGQYNLTFLQPGRYEVVLGGGNFGKVATRGCR